MSTFPESVTALLQELIRIPSVNPEGEAGTPPEFLGEAKIAARVAELLTELGAEVELDEILPSRPNVIGRFPSSGNRPKILLAPHLDTVSVKGMTIPPFGAEIRDGKVWGRGASDTKGTMAAMLWALHLLTQAPGGLAALPYDIEFIGFMSEETGQDGSKAYASGRGQTSPIALAIIGEPTQNTVVHTHKGCLGIYLMTSGESCHASIPEQGENAIIKAAALIQKLDTEFREQLKTVGGSNPVLGHSTVNIAMINGGHRANIVPDFCKIVLDIRYTPELHAQGGALQLLTDCLADTDVQIQLAWDCSPLNTDPETPLVRHLAAIGNGLAGAPWFCDAAYLAAAGIPAVAAGPGSIAQAHTEDEFLFIADLESGVHFYRNFLTAPLPNS